VATWSGLADHWASRHTI